MTSPTITNIHIDDADPDFLVVTFDDPDYFGPVTHLPTCAAAIDHLRANPTLALTGSTLADANGWLCEVCFDVTPRFDIYAGMNLKASGKALEASAQRAAKPTPRPSNAASEKQMAFIESLMAERGLADQNPADVFFNSDNDRTNRSDILTKKEASYVIDCLMKMAKVVIVGETEDDDVKLDEVTYDAAAITAAAAERASTKFTPDEMTPELIMFATDWAKAYDGDFSFMVDMAKSAQRGPLSQGQAKGTMNCYLAAIRRGDVEVSKADGKPAATGRGIDLSNVPNGTYAVPGGATRLKVRINKVDKAASNWHGWTFVDDGAAYGYGKKYGRQAPGKTYTGAIEDELAAIAADPLAAAAAYGELTGRCCCCNRVLEDELSVERGVGPYCFAKYFGG